MTAALKTQTSAAGTTRAALAARLDQLLRHAITADDFEADVARACKLDPEDIWVVLALLDQYHRLGKLPTDLFRTLKSSADRRGLGRRGLPVPEPQVPAAPASPVGAIPQSAPAAPPSVALLPPPPTPPVIVPTLGPALWAPAAPVSAAAPPKASVATAPAAPALGVGSVLRSRYLLVAELSRDHRGTLYQAVDQAATEVPPDLRHVAIQVLRHGDSDAGLALAELRQEFRDAQQLSHPNIVRVRELDHDGACYFMTMDFVPGESLTALLGRRQRKALPRATALAIIRDLGAALVHAHERGVVHGDLQPHYVMISATGEVRVRGFGAVRASSNYASCEQLENRVADRRDDLYALACIGYELLSGSHPFGLLNAAAARGRGLVPTRPMMLTRTQWQALRIGLAWRRENRTVGVAWWLAQMRLGRATRRLPALDALVLLPPPRRSWLRPLLLMSGLAVAIAAAAALDRLPDRAMLMAGLSELISAEEAAPALLHRLGDALSPGVAVPAVPVPAAPAVRVTPPVVKGTPHSRKLRLATADLPSRPANSSAAAETSAADALAAPRAVEAGPGASVGTALVELSADHYTVLPGESAARIVVRRHGRLQGDVSFAWWTESASAAAGRDYVDWGRRAEQIPAGHNSITLLVPIVSDATRRGQSRVFYVAIGDTGGGAELGDTARAAVLMPGGG